MSMQDMVETVAVMGDTFRHYDGEPGTSEFRLKAPIEIMVAGGIHTGKTVVISIIEKALKEAGFWNVKLHGVDETEDGRNDLLCKLEASSVVDKPTTDFLSKEINVREVMGPPMRISNKLE